MPTTIHRNPRAYALFIAGGQLVDVPFLSARSSRGFDQNVATCEIELPYRTGKLSVDTWCQVVFDDGIATTPGGFTGRIDGYSYQNYPQTVTIHLRGPLGLAESFYPDTPLDISGFTDIGAITGILEACGVPSDRLLILGTGAVLGASVAPGDQRFVWQPDQSALDMIQAIDQITLGFRTFDSFASGTIIRRLITSVPSDEPSITFHDGATPPDATSNVILAGSSAEWETVRGKASWTVLGTMDAQGQQVRQTFTGTTSPVRRGNGRLDAKMVGDATQAADLAQWLQREAGKPMMRAVIITPEGRGLAPGLTVLVNDPTRLGMNKRAWLQSAVVALEANGGFAQTLGIISEIVDDPTPSTFAGQPDPGQGALQEPVANDFASDPAAYAPTADFTFEVIDHEVDESDQDIWVVVVTDASWSPSGPITAYAWSTDTTTIPETGTERRFITKITDIATVITLEVTDTSAQTATVSKACNSDEAQAVTIDRHIYVAGNDHALAYDGNRNWNSQSFTTQVVGNGPMWNEGVSVDISTDELATAPASVAAFASESVSAVWCETDFSSSRLYAGGDGGSVSTSETGGQIWTEKAGPSAFAILRIIASRFAWNEITILDANGDVYQSADNGLTWGFIKSHPGAVDLAESNFRNWVGGSFGVAIMESPTSLATWPGATPNIVAIAAHIREDRVYAMADDGTTYYTDPAGGLAMVAGEPIPGGTAQVRGLTRDGAVIDLIYVCTGAGGLYKSSDGLRTAPGYHLMHSAEALMSGYGDSPIDFTAPTPIALFFAFAGGSSGGM